METPSGFDAAAWAAARFVPPKKKDELPLPLPWESPEYTAAARGTVARHRAALASLGASSGAHIPECIFRWLMMARATESVVFDKKSTRVRFVDHSGLITDDAGNAFAKRAMTLCLDALRAALPAVAAKHGDRCTTTDARRAMLACLRDRWAPEMHARVVACPTIRAVPPGVLPPPLPGVTFGRVSHVAWGTPEFRGAVVRAMATPADLQCLLPAHRLDDPTRALWDVVTKIVLGQRYTDGYEYRADATRGDDRVLLFVGRGVKPRNVKLTTFVAEALRLAVNVLDETARALVARERAKGTDDVDVSQVLGHVAWLVGCLDEQVDRWRRAADIVVAPMSELEELRVYKRNPDVATWADRAARLRRALGAAISRDVAGVTAELGPGDWASDLGYLGHNLVHVPRRGLWQLGVPERIRISRRAPKLEANAEAASSSVPPVVVAPVVVAPPKRKRGRPSNVTRIGELEAELARAELARAELEAKLTLAEAELAARADNTPSSPV